MKKTDIRTLLEINNDALAITDLSGIISEANHPMELLTGLTREELINTSLASYFIMPAQVEKMLRCVLQDGKLSNIELAATTPGGETRMLSYNAMLFHDEEGKAQGIVVAGRDTKNLTFFIEHDTLTGLPNRSLLFKRINFEISKTRQTNSKIAIVFMGLDNFKKINVSYGHATGDQLLREVATRLRKVTRECDLVTRPGGDENILILSGIPNKKCIEKHIQEILEKIAEVYTINARPFYVTASIGISVYPTDGKDAATLLKNADIALYNAKALGGNTYQFAPVKKTKLLSNKIKLEHDLRNALKNNEFVLHYQPIFNVITHKVSRLEALIRWKTPTGKLKLPEEFIPLAEEFKLMNPLGEWVIKEALLQCVKLQASNFGFCKMAINLSASQLNSELVHFLKDKIAEYSIPADSLYLELTENSLIKMTENLDLIFQELLNMGIKLSIDDFGIGYSSLHYLKLLCIENLKIDKLFIAETPDNPNSVAIVSAILAIASSLNISVTAEGVETQRQMAFLSEKGCTECQGYYLSKPLTEEQLIPFLKKNLL